MEVNIVADQKVSVKEMKVIAILIKTVREPTFVALITVLIWVLKEELEVIGMNKMIAVIDFVHLTDPVCKAMEIVIQIVIVRDQLGCLVFKIAVPTINGFL